MVPKTGYKTSHCTSQLKISPTAPLLANSSTWLRGRCTTAQLHIPLTSSSSGKNVWLLPASSPCLQSFPPLPSLFSVPFPTLILQFPLEINWNNPTAEGGRAPQSPSCWNTPLTQGHSTHCLKQKHQFSFFAERKAPIKAQILTVSLV